MGYMEGVTVEYGEGFTAGTEGRESGSMGRLAEHSWGLRAGGADEMEWAQWSCLPSAPEPHYF